METLQDIRRMNPSGTSGVQTKVVRITPAEARDMLTRQRNMRPLNERDVAYLTGEILAGRWVLNGESVKVDREGFVVDGQHRLAACARADRPIETVLVIGGSGVAVDEGRKRSFADVIGGRGWKQSSITASMIRTLYEFSLGRDPWTVSRNRLPNAVLDDFFKSLDQDRLTEAVKIANATQGLMSVSVAGVVAYQASHGKPIEMVGDFFMGMASGADLRDGSPQLSLRRWLESGRGKRRSGQTWIRSVYVATVRAWNCYVEARDVRGPALWTHIHDVELPAVIGA